MSRIISGDEVVTGTAEDDVILITGGDGAGVVEAGAGNDVVWGDHGPLIASAGGAGVSLDNPAFWTTIDDPEIGDSSLPHVTVAGTGRGEYDRYFVTLVAGQRVSIDPDGAFLLIAANGRDTLFTGDPDLGLDGVLAPFGGLFDTLEFVAPADGVYTIGVGQFERLPGFPGDEFIGEITVGREYQLHISVAGHAATAFGPYGADTLRGGDGADRLYGVEGADLLEGGAGDDILVGGVGDDVLVGGAGVDRLLGGKGFDIADYRSAAGGVEVALDGPFAADVLVGGVLEDELTGVEGVYGGAFVDRLTGDGADNVFRPGGGDDVIDGGRGRDTVDYRDKAAAIRVDLAGSAAVLVFVGGVAEDTIRNVEAVRGAGAADTLNGDAANNELFGEGGNDRLRGGLGRDLLDGGAGVDLADYSDRTSAINAQLDGVLFEEAGFRAEDIVIIDGAVEDSLFGIEIVYGGSGDDTFYGGDEDNLFRGGPGADFLSGGLGRDAADYRDKTVPVVVTMSSVPFIMAVVGGVEEDHLFGIEDLYGGSAGDTFRGDAIANRLFGGGGADVLRGLGGADQLTGGAGADAFVFAHASESGPSASTRDTILDFSRIDRDRILLQGIDADSTVAGNQAFVLGPLTVGSPGRLEITADGPGRWLVRGDTDGVSGAELSILVVSPLAPVGTDFVL